MLAKERRNEILAQLKDAGRVIVADLSKKYEVTEETIRRDLEKIENDGFAERTYGGAVLKENDKEELPYLVRKRSNVEIKKRIAEKIADMIQDGSWQRAISDNTKGTAYTPNAKYNPPEPTEGER
mgnify:CR=1 FL=1